MQTVNVAKLFQYTKLGEERLFQLCSDSLDFSTPYEHNYEIPERFLMILLNSRTLNACISERSCEQPAPTLHQEKTTTYNK
jgi:hypothetical protein